MTRTHGKSSDLQNHSAKGGCLPPNTFTSLVIDRASRRRRDEAWIAERLRASTTRFLPVWGSRVLVTDEPAPRAIWLTPEEASPYLPQADVVILLGEHRERDRRYSGNDVYPRAYFAIGLSTEDESPPASLAAIGTFRRLRAVAPLLDGEMASLLAYAKAMVHYHRQHRFCPACGAPTVSREGGHLRVCTNAQCGLHDFPRTDPAIIVLVSSEGRCLLGRQPTWSETLYSIIAGFVEPGESLEAAVAREVQEETGIRVGRVRYHSSQPWPFPRSLMIGFTATAETTAIQLNDGELADARWASREEIVRELRQGTLQLPSSISVSHRLIETWFDAEGPLSLKEILESR